MTVATKPQQRLRRRRRVRAKVVGTAERPRLSVFRSNRGVFAQHYATEALDASVLLMPLVRFLPADDPRVRATVLAIAAPAHAGPKLQAPWDKIDFRSSPAAIEKQLAVAPLPGPCNGYGSYTLDGICSCR